jgi:hypothetical protein
LEQTFHKDEKLIEGLFRTNNLTLNFHEFTNYSFVIRKALLYDKESHKRKSERAKNLLAQLFICKNVLINLATYAIEQLSRVKIVFEKYKQNKDFFLNFAKEYLKFTGCLTNCGLIIYDYRDVFEDIRKELDKNYIVRRRHRKN